MIIQLLSARDNVNWFMTSWLWDFSCHNFLATKSKKIQNSNDKIRQQWDHTRANVTLKILLKAESLSREDYDNFIINSCKNLLEWRVCAIGNRIYYTFIIKNNATSRGGAKWWN